MAGKTAHQFAQEFVHNIHIQRLAENQKPNLKSSEVEPQIKRSELYKSASFTNYHPDPKDADSRPSGPSVYTYLSNTIKMELEKKSNRKNRDHIENGMLHKLCKSMLCPETAKRIEEKANVLHYKANQEVLCERLNKEALEWKDKLEEGKKRFLQEELVECSFVPKINDSSNGKTFKNHEEYYAYQLKWDEKIKDNIVIFLEDFNKENFV